MKPPASTVSPAPAQLVATAALKSRLAEWCRLGLDLVYPPACAACQAELESSAAGLLCAECRQRFVSHAAACPRCAATAVAATLDDRGCPQCRDQRLHFDAALRLGAYEGPLRAAVLQLKRPGGRPLALTLADLLAESLAAQQTTLACDAVVPVPMHWSRKMWRGVNGAETIAERVAQQWNLPLAAHLLARRKRTAPQARLSTPRRLANVRGAFRARAHRDLPGARLLLVDDIMTTGATLNEAARVLRRAGAGFVAVAVLARAPGVG